MNAILKIEVDGKIVMEQRIELPTKDAVEFLAHSHDEQRKLVRDSVAMGGYCGPLDND